MKPSGKLFWPCRCHRLRCDSCQFVHDIATASGHTATAAHARPCATAETGAGNRTAWCLVSDPSRLDWDRTTTELQRAGFNTMYVNFASGAPRFIRAAV